MKTVLMASFFVCSCVSENERISEDPNQLELVIEDSIKINYLGRVDGLEFKNRKGVLFNFKENKLLEFDECGKILHEQSYPFDGPEKVLYPAQLKYTEEGKLYWVALRIQF